MPTWQVVSKKNHANAGWLPPTNYRQTQHISAVPVLAAEVSHLMPFYPLGFLKNHEGQLQLFAMLGLKSGSNAFLNKDNRWTASYIPATLRSYPFSLIKNAEGKNVLAADIEAEFFHLDAQAGDKPVLSDDGGAHESLNDLIQFMIQCDAQQQQTDRAVALLAEHNLLTEWRVPVTSEGNDTEQTLLSGLYTIDENALQSLAGNTLEALAQSGALGIAYAQLFSKVRLKDLLKRQQLHDSQAQSTQMDDVDLDKLFGEGNDEDLFSF